MTETLLSLLSIVFGIIGANLAGHFLKKYSFGFTGNTLIGVFGSVFFIKSFGRLGLSPSFIVNEGNINIFLLCLNLFVSILGGVIVLILLSIVKNRIFN